MARSAEAPPPEGLAPSPVSLMPEQSTPLSGMRGATVDISDVRENQQVNADYDPKSCPIQSEKIPITTIYRPDLMPDRVEGSIAPIVEYDMDSVDSVPVSLPKFDVPGLNAEVDDSIRVELWLQPACLPAIASANIPGDEWERLLPISSNASEWLSIRCLIRLQSRFFVQRHTIHVNRLRTRTTRSRRTLGLSDQSMEKTWHAIG